MSLSNNKINQLLSEMSITALKISPFKSYEDDSFYDVWLIETNESKFVIKPSKNFELQIYREFLDSHSTETPRLISEIIFEEKQYLLLEYIDGKSLCKCDRNSLKNTLDALISIQDKFWNDVSHSNIGYTFENSLKSRIDRSKYLMDTEIENEYQKFLSLYTKLPRTLCHDDLLPFNVIVSSKSSFIIDWEYAGILPYPTSIARLIAHTENNEEAIFYMTEEDKDFAIQYYYEKLVKKHSISYSEYIDTINLFLLYEYCEWIMLTNKHPNDYNKELSKKYIQKAKKIIQQG